MSTRSRPKPQVRLLNHRTVAGLCDVSTECLRDWVARGEFPRPRSIVGQTWLYDAGLIEHWIETGQWGEGAVFNQAREGKVE